MGVALFAEQAVFVILDTEPFSLHWHLAVAFQNVAGIPRAAFGGQFGGTHVFLPFLFLAKELVASRRVDTQGGHLRTMRDVALFLIWL